jgi:hypothetical protein
MKSAKPVTLGAQVLGMLVVAVLGLAILMGFALLVHYWLLAMR